MARFSSFALATLLTLGSMSEINLPAPAQACEAVCGQLIVAGISAIASWMNSSNAADAQAAASKAQAAATIKAAEMQAEATNNMAKAQIQAALIQANAQIVTAVENRKTQIELERLRNENNTQQKLIDTGMAPLSSFNRRFGQSIQPIYAPASNRATRAAYRAGVGGFKLFRY